MGKRSVLAVLAALLMFSCFSFAGDILLLGTDAVSYHDRADFGQPIFSDLSNGSSKPILVINDYGLTGFYANGAYDAAFAGSSGGFYGASSLSGLTLSDYAAIFLASPGTCCSDPTGSLTSSDASAVAAFLTGGGNLGVEDFMGVCESGAPNISFYQTVLGFDPSAGVSDSCGGGDPEVATAAGLAKGYPSSTYVGTFGHQLYLASFFDAHGYTDLAYAGNYGADEGEVIMESGVAPVPEPASLLLLGSGLLAAAGVTRKKWFR